MILLHDKTFVMNARTVLHDERMILPKKRGNLPSARTSLRWKKAAPNQRWSAEPSVLAQNELYSVKKPSSTPEIP
jgi:hypothetical protein